jgi:hypothetical protein
MHRYIQQLEEAGGSFLALAKKLGSQKAQPLLEKEKAVVRLACLGRVDRLLGELRNKFLSGASLMDSTEWSELCDLGIDLRSKDG